MHLHAFLDNVQDKDDLTERTCLWINVTRYLWRVQVIGSPHFPFMAQILFLVKTSQMMLSARQSYHLTVLSLTPASGDLQSSLSLSFRATRIQMEKSVHTATRT